MRKGLINNAIRNGLLLGSAAAILLYFLISFLIGVDINTVYAQTIGKFIIIGAFVLYGFNLLKKEFNDDFKLFPGILQGIIIGITSAIISTAFELISMNFGYVLKPEIFQEMEVPQLILSILFSVEMIGYSLIASLVGIQYYKKEHKKRENIQTSEA